MKFSLLSSLAITAGLTSAATLSTEYELAASEIAAKQAIGQSYSLMQRPGWRRFVQDTELSHRKKVDPNAPQSKVPDVSTGEGKVYPGTISKTIRYGPYRLPGKNVRFYMYQFRHVQ
jgi:hypothetical protein